MLRKSVRYHRLNVRKRHKEKEAYRASVVKSLKSGTRIPEDIQKENGWFSMPDAILVRCSSDFLSDQNDRGIAR